MVKKILISQPEPTSENSPYYKIAEDCEVELTFRPYIKIVGISLKEFRQQKLEIGDYTAIVFTTRHAIDNYFAIAKELRYQVPETTKYFCISESIALYIQKYVQYRKRKVFFSTTGKIDEMLPAMQKHCKENYLIPLSDVSGNSISQLLTEHGIKNTQCYLYRTVSNNFTPEELEKFKFNMGVFFSPLGIKAFHEDFPKPKRGFKIATFGANTAKAARDLGLKIELEAPTEKYTSMTDALRHYLLSQQ